MTLDNGSENAKENGLEHVLGIDFVQVQSSINQCAILNKSRLGQILEQLFVQVWNRSKSKPDILKLSNAVIGLLCLLENDDLSANAINAALGYGATYDLKRKIIIPLSQLGYILMSHPDKPTSVANLYAYRDRKRII